MANKALKSVGTVQDALNELDELDNDPVSRLALLRGAFPPNQISKLPKESRQQIDDRKNNRNGINCTVCNGWHHPKAIHLDYVGHAALTDRLLDTDPTWTWEPVGFTPEGLPALDRNGGLWIKLTVCGVTRYGYGAADGKSGGDAMKEMIGDALRNAAMRFGAALELWHKGDLHVDYDTETGEVFDRPKGPPHNGDTHRDDPFPQGPCRNRTELKAKGRDLWRDVEACGDSTELECLLADKDNQKIVTQIMKALPRWWDGATDKSGESFEGLEAVIERKRREFAELENA